MGFNRGVTVKIRRLNKIGVVVDIKRDKYNQPVYDIDCNGKVYVCRGFELDGSLEATRPKDNPNEGVRIQSK